MPMANIADIKLVATDWNLLGEGNAHIVLQYRPKNHPQDDRLIGKVLRISKKFQSEQDLIDIIKYQNEAIGRLFDAPFVPSARNEYLAETSTSTSTKIATADHTALTPTVTIKPTSYSPAYSIIRVPSGFLSQISDLVQPFRATARLHASINTEQTNVTLLDDLTYDQSISFEIKPKWGFNPYYPRPCRFCTHYKFKQMNTAAGSKIENANPSDEAINSNTTQSYTSANTSIQVPKLLDERPHFCPLDLFSMNPERIEKALHQLFANPMNNLKIFKPPTSTTPLSPHTFIKALTRIILEDPVFERLNQNQWRFHEDVRGFEDATLEAVTSVTSLIGNAFLEPRHDLPFPPSICGTSKTPLPISLPSKNIASLLLSTSLKDLSVFVSFRKGGMALVEVDGEGYDVTVKIVDLDYKGGKGGRLAWLEGELEKVALG